ncbi:sensor histidine kinase [Paenibacillus sp. FSL R7-0128]|uniref:sensor histidine kinase n=1 Tax=Paenibacillus sp. FSL R7-0128 TaxID=2954529 RepID=UPI0030F6A97D
MRASRAYVPFSYKITIPYLLIMLLTEIFIGVYTYTRLSESSSVLTGMNMKMTFQQLTNNISYQFQDTQQISDTLFQSTEIQKVLNSEAGPFEIYQLTRDQLLPLLAAPLQSTRSNIRIMLYVKNESFQEYFKNLKLPLHEKSYNLLYASRIEQQPWFRQLEAGKQDNSWLQIDTDYEQGNLSLFRKLISFNDYQTEVGYLRISARLDDLFQSLNTVKVGDESIVQVREQTTGDILYQPDTRVKKQKDEAYLTVAQEIPGTPYAIEILVPKQYYLRDAHNIRNVTLTVCIASFLTMLLLGLMVAKLYNRKMQKIISYVRSFRSGEFGKRIHIPGQDEFAQISLAFNQAASDMDNLIRTVYLQKIHVKEAELQALQYQINPHFLYNTLSSINSLANMGQTEKVSRMVTGLTKFYRLTLNDGRNMIPLASELEQVRSYINIQKIKYSDRFDTQMEVEAGLLGCEVTKLILQPFVENALKHAWCHDRLSIRIVGRRELNRILLFVIDNGIGIHREQVRAINDGRAVTSGCGIRNVHDRISLKYGEGYGVRVFSIYGGGTTVQLTLPYELPYTGTPIEPNRIQEAEQ